MLPSLESLAGFAYVRSKSGRTGIVNDPTRYILNMSVKEEETFMRIHSSLEMECGIQVL